MSIEKLKNIGLDKLIPTIYDFGGMTEQETWCKFAQKINIIIEHFNYLNTKFDNQKELVKTKLEYLLSEGLTKEISEQLLKLIDNGTLEQLINETALKNINDKVTNLEKLQINVLDLGVKGDGTEEDITIINSIFNNIENKKIIFPPNKTYKITSPIIVKAKKCDILFEGKIIADCDALLLDEVENCSIKINEITKTTVNNVWYDFVYGNKEIIDYSTFENYAIKFNNVRNCLIGINYLQGYKQGLFFNPSVYGNNIPSGSQYNTIHFNSIEACCYPIHFLLGRDGTWANSNFINGGNVTGYYAIYLQDFNNTGDIYNQNVFNNIGMEYLKGGGIVLEQGKENLFNNFRMDKVDNFYIKTNEKTYANKFVSNYIHHIEGCDIQGKNNILELPTSKYSDPTNVIATKVYYNNNKSVKTGFDVTEKSFENTEGYTLKDSSVFTSAYKYIKDGNNNYRTIYPFPDTMNINYQNVYLDVTNIDKILYINYNGNVNLVLSDEIMSIINGQHFKILTSSTFTGSINFIKANGSEYIKSISATVNTYYNCFYVKELTEMVVIKLGEKI